MSEPGPSLGVDAGPLSSRVELEAILDKVADGITVQDATGAVVYANDAAARLVGLDSAAELLATPPGRLLDRFELLDEHGAPFPPARLPGRLALTGVESEAVICYRARGSGSRRWSIVRATPILDESGDVGFAVNAFQDITARKEAEERLRLLADTSSLLGALDVEATLARIPELVVPRLADACSVWYAEGAWLHRLASFTHDPAKQAAYDELAARYSLEDDADTLMVSLFLAGEPVLMPELTPDVRRSVARDERDLDAVDRIGTQSAIIHPLVARGRNFGLLSLISFEPGRFDESDLAITRELADHVALALDRALLFRESEEAQRDLTFLAESGELFASSLDRDETLRRISRVVVPRIADACNIFLAEGGLLRRVAHAHVDPELERIMDGMPNRYSLGDDMPEPFDRIRRGEALLVPTIEGDVVEALAKLGLDSEAFRRVGSRSMIFVPFVSRGQLLGLMSLGVRQPGAYGERDLELAREVARRAAVAIENATNYERAQALADASQALEFVGDGVLLVDRDRIVRLWNPAAESITGLLAGDVVGRPVAEAIPGWAALEPHVPISRRPETLPLGLGDRERWLSISGVDFGDGVVYAFRDVTDERALERMKTDFISTVSHELRTPLAAIYGAAMTVRRSGALPADRREELIALIGSESERLARTIDDVLWASRLESGRLELRIASCDPAGLLEAAVAARRTHLPENLELELDAPAGLPQVAADPDKVRQAIENLLDNAIKYSPDGGTIRVSAEVAGRYVRFAVADEGLGIPASERERIFSKFYRLDPDLTRGVGGTGLGLYISQALVRRMGGRIAVTANGKAGSLFTVDLPVAAENGEGRLAPPLGDTDGSA
jgi:PAS domain S-box-containing protein